MNTAYVIAALALVAHTRGCPGHYPQQPAPSTTSSHTTREADIPASDGVLIHYRDEGAGPAVVLVHCWTCNLSYWDSSATELARDHRVLRLDLPGHGRSGTGRARYSVEQFADDIRAVVDDAKVDRFVVVGHSMSGPIVVEAAIKMPTRVVGVVPIDTLSNVDKTLSDEARAAFFAKLRADFRGTVEPLVRSLMAKDADVSIVNRILSDCLSFDPRRASDILEPTWAYPAASKIEQVHVPIVAIESESARVDVAANRKHAPQFEARVMSGVGHWLMLDKPMEFAHVLREVVVSMEASATTKK
jgi:pimeloyl-ACP methyl ester carboxylesterase